MSQKLVLYHYWRSSCSWRVRWSLAHKNIAYKSVAVDLLTTQQQSRDFLAKNPAGYVPCLEIDGTPLAESLAILEWLEEAYPEKPLMPVDPMSRAFVRQLCLTIVAGTQPLQNLKAQKYFSSDEAVRRAYTQYWITQGLEIYESLINKGAAGTFSFGGQLSIADLCLIPQCYNAERFGVDLGQFPKIKGIYTKCMLLPACKKSSPDEQPGAKKP
jgi:maleylacetoacetate isomerase